MPDQMIIASHNAGKYREITHALQGINANIAPFSQSESLPVPAESGLTFVENALIKARFACAQTGLAALADDSGLCVNALNGAPGIHSARYAGEQANDRENIVKLLKNINDLPMSQRQAYFFCVMVYLRHAEDPDPIITTGKWHGTILNYVIGESGFGYDPVFYVPSHECSAAQLPLAVKNEISHRGLALKAFISAYRESGE